MTAPLRLESVELRKSYRNRAVVNGVSIAVAQGEIVGLLGPNGAGKTTTFYMTVGLIQPQSGQVLLGGQEITRWPMYLRARAGVGYLAQEPSIFRRLSVEDNLRAIAQMHYPGRQEQARVVDGLLDELGLTRLRSQPAVTLSGGEKRRCEIARALISEPKFLLLDEPFVGIDPITVADIQGIIAQLKTRGLGILITDHNVRETLQIIDRAYIMYDGRIMFEGGARELTENPEARRVYLGENFRL